MRFVEIECGKQNNGSHRSHALVPCSGKRNFADVIKGTDAEVKGLL